MDTASRKEELSFAYISALCAIAGISLDRQFHDDDSTDATLKKLVTLSDGQRFQSILRIQLKSTSSPLKYRDNKDSVAYTLKTKNYNDLRTLSTTPIVLALLILPENEDEWLIWTQEDLMLKGRMYWKSFKDSPEIENINNITISIPKANYLNADTLLELLQNAAEGL